MKKNNTLTVIIPTYNRYEKAVRLARKIRSFDGETEIIIVNQGTKEELPTNGSFLVLYQKYPSLPKARNLGIKKARGKIIVFFDDDVEITKDTLPSHVKAYKDGLTIAVAGRVINRDEKLPQDLNIETGKTNKLASAFLYRFFSTRKQIVDFPYGCNMSFMKAALQEIGGFDENLKPPIYSFNEIDVGVRINKKWPDSLIFKPGTLVYHDRYPFGGTRSYKEEDVSYSNNFNYGYFVAKNYAWTENAIFLLRRAPYQLTSEPKGIIPLIRGFLYGKKIKNR